MKYVGFYAPKGSTGAERTNNLASQSKMDYLIRLLNELGEEVEIVSPSWIVEKRSVREPQTELRLSEGCRLTLAPSASSKHRSFRGAHIAGSLWWLFRYLVKNTKKGETVLAYHVQWTAYPLILAKRFKKLRLVLEVEEIYSRVWDFPRPLDRMERKLIAASDAFIVSTELLLDQLPEKPSAVVYGNYSVDPAGRRDRGDGKVRFVYAGLIDSVKGGAFIAVRACEFLDERFELKLIGFGSDGSVSALENEIAAVNEKLGRKACEYCGVKRGEEYSEFMRSMDIGVNPQIVSDIDRAEFPSKVISYLSFGLAAVSTKLRCLTASKVADLIEFSEDDTPEGFARAMIRAAELPKADTAKRLESLHAEILEELKGMLL